MLRVFLKDTWTGGPRTGFKVRVLHVGDDLNFNKVLCLDVRKNTVL